MHRTRVIIFLLFFLLAAAVPLLLTIGTVPVGFSDIFGIIVSKVGFWFDSSSPPALSEAIIWDIRLPRILLGLFVGACLGISGAVMQALFRNPLADPSIVGISAGAALFAALSILLGSAFSVLQFFGVWLLSIAAFLGALLATLIVFAISKEKTGISVATMLLAGIALNALAGAGTGLVVYAANDLQLRTLIFWTLGSLSSAGWPIVGILSVVMLLAFFFLGRFHKAFNALALGEAEALNLGISVEKLKWQVIFFTALSVGASVAFCGIIGFVGLVVPHILRLLGGSDYRYLLPASACGGALLLSLADAASRTWAAPTELPIGIITALFGAPVFLWLIYQSKRNFDKKTGE